MSNQQQKTSRGRLIAATLAAACALGAASLAAADGERAPAQAPHRVVVNQVQVNGDGMRVYIDPATGKIKQPTREEVQALDKAIASLPSHALKNLQAMQFSDGTVALALDDSFLNYALVRINSDGSVSGACIDNSADANAFLNGNAPALEEQ